MPKVELAPWQLAAIENPFSHFAMFGGVATGKTYTGSNFAVKMIRERPELTGFIGANNYDQLSQATLRELFYLLDKYRFQYVIDRRPPKEWNITRQSFKNFANILTVRNPRTGQCTMIFTRVLAKPNPLRGIEFSWYWLDETRDTPQNTHDVVLSRMRESDIMKGLLTTTTNGEDWGYQRFVLGNTGDGLYGSMHVSTEESVRAGIITEAYYSSMRRSYSPMMAAQELDAQHVNVAGGIAYYASSKANKRSIAPWGARTPDRNRPLIVGCDFNFQPAPCVWVVGQVGPGPEWSNHIHWFGEISGVQMSTVSMTLMLMTRFPDFFYRVYGDASGERGTTSNAGETDYNQIARTFSEAGALFTIDVNQSNPRVKDRIENMNGLLKNSLGEIRMTYDPMGCPLLDGDMRIVGWKKRITSGGQGKLDDAGDHQRTHASDAAGYAVWKLFPPGRRASVIAANVSAVRPEI